MKLLFLIIVVFALFSNNTEKSYIHGTMILCGVASDGIVVAVDSRGAIKGYNNENIAYADSMCKLTVLNTFPIMIGNQSTIGTTFVTSIIRQYCKSHNSQGLRNTVFSFNKYLSESYGDRNTIFVISGYENNIPCIFTITNNNIQASHEGVVSNIEQVGNYLKSISVSHLNCDDLAKKFENIIYRYAKEHRSEGTIGGPISIMKIHHNGNLEWIKNNFTVKDTGNYAEFYLALKSGNRKLYPIIKYGDKLALKVIEENLKH